MYLGTYSAPIACAINAQVVFANDTTMPDLFFIQPTALLLDVSSVTGLLCPFHNCPEDQRRTKRTRYAQLPDSRWTEAATIQGETTGGR
jgi:hypothetical protein